MLQSNVQFSLMLLALPLAHVIAQDEDTTTQCTEACGCKRRLAARIRLYTEQFKAAMEQQKRNELAAAKYTLAAVAGYMALRRSLIPVITAASTINSQCRSELAAATQPTLAAILAAGETLGIYDGVNLISKVGGCFKAAPDGSNNLPANQLTETSIGQPAASECRTTNGWEQAKQPSMASEDKEAGPEMLKLHSKLTAKCTATGVNTCHNNQLGSGGSLEIKLTYEATKQTANTASWTTNSHDREHVIATAEIDLLKDNASNVNEMLKKLRATAGIQNCGKDVTAYAELTRQINCKLYASKALISGYAAEKEAETATLNVAATAAYGPCGKDFSANIWDKVQETLVPVKENEHETLKPISTLSRKAHVYEALARVLLKKQKNEQEDQQKVSKNFDATKDKECNGKKGDECTGECEWDKEKKTCTPKKKGEAKNKEKTGTTNKTGSNSFVINKAPLLLVFFLL
ncbi:variant surface glycoprotein [Trypanosoma brucei equiperdum]|uniref:Variant surface glycoprotein n=1 Tax=Trypanosoma brucei equiperdum TaxID=630700 RepID=A0A3L6LBR0_9TRYP|nr:variant surface glycoprotein [Trypanosoma brucei equiperdum]